VLQHTETNDDGGWASRCLRDPFGRGNTRIFYLWNEGLRWGGSACIVF
jgi:hypothetical protein